jgi:MFS family permease
VTTQSPPPASDRYALDGRYAFARLAWSLLFGAIVCIGSWSVVVALPAVQADFGVVRGAASWPYTLMMIGFASGAIGMGRLVDRLGIVTPILIAAVSLGAGYVAAGLSPSLALYALAHLFIGFGCSIGFAPLIADVSHWFRRRRALAVSVAAAGNYLAGAIWSPVLQGVIEQQGWRFAHIAMGLITFAVMLAMAPLFRRRPAAQAYADATVASDTARGELGLSPTTLMIVLSVAGFSCCMAMAMPQVHLVAYCTDLGYGAARGAEMLALMLGLGLISRVGSGWLADRFGGLNVLLVGSAMQGLALFLYLFFDGLAALYIITGIFGLFQGGIVPMYAVIAREYLPPREAGQRIGVVIVATIIGMAVGGLASGYIFDVAGSYHLAFLNGLMWNLLNIGLVAWLIAWPRLKAGRAAPGAQAA